MVTIEADIQEKRVEIDNLRESYAQDLKRVKELYDLGRGR